MSGISQAIQHLRALEADSNLERLFLTIAEEVVTTTGGADDENVLDSGYLELTNSEREAYLKDQVASLAQTLRRSALCWGLLDAELVKDWRARTGR